MSYQWSHIEIWRKHNERTDHRRHRPHRPRPHPLPARGRAQSLAADPRPPARRIQPAAGRHRRGLGWPYRAGLGRARQRDARHRQPGGRQHGLLAVDRSAQAILLEQPRLGRAGRGRGSPPREEKARHPHPILGHQPLRLARRGRHRIHASRGRLPGAAHRRLGIFQPAGRGTRRAPRRHPHGGCAFRRQRHPETDGTSRPTLLWRTTGEWRAGPALDPHRGRGGRHPLPA